jgi:hypothetical protein
LPKIAEIDGFRAVDSKIVSIDRAEKRVVSLSIGSAPQLQELKSRLSARW